MNDNWDDNIRLFLRLANKHKLEIIMVGGGAVNFHGYQRHSADVDFWIDTSESNLRKLLMVFKEMGYDIDSIPSKVKNKEQNISLKFSPDSLEIELITNFSVNKTFEEALRDSEKVQTKDEVGYFNWNVLSLEDLITSKIKSGRNKDYLDVQELKKIHKI